MEALPENVTCIWSVVHFVVRSFCLFTNSFIYFGSVGDKFNACLPSYGFLVDTVSKSVINLFHFFVEGFFSVSSGLTNDHHVGVACELFILIG